MWETVWEGPECVSQCGMGLLLLVLAVKKTPTTTAVLTNHRVPVGVLPPSGTVSHTVNETVPSGAKHKD